METLFNFNNQILTNEIIDKVIFEIVAKKLYIPQYARRNLRLKKLADLEDVRFSDTDTADIIRNSPQNHKEAGFDKGWPSRFDTFYKFAKELGFVYYEMGKPIEISETGIYLAKSAELEFEHLEQQMFLNAFVKYQRNNPFRRVLNANKPLILLLKVIKQLGETDGKSKGISRLEIPLLLCWKDADAANLVEHIKKIRKRYGVTPSSEVIYDECKNILGLQADDEKRFKKSNILNEMPDDFIRKMRLTGLISLRGNGRFIDFNSLEIKKIRYVLDKYAGILSAFTTEREYYEYMRTVDTSLITIKAQTISSKARKEKLFTKWLNCFDLITLKKELLIVCNNRLSSQDDVLKYISEPARFEFLTALALKKAYPLLRVSPNYNIDDEGLPTSFAQGGVADIICCDDRGNILFEVTLLTGTQQNIREMPAIARHLRECIDIVPDSFSVLLCPHAHSDTLEYAEFIKSKYKVDIIVLETERFVDTLGVYVDAREYRS
jgi:hypothetical protein